MAAIGTELKYGDEAWTSWFDRQAENCQFRGELVDFYASDSPANDPILQISIYHKNSDDTGDGTAASDGAGGNAVLELGNGQVSGDISVAKAVDLKELVRFKFEWPAGVADDWIRHRLLTPAWFDASSNS